MVEELVRDLLAAGVHFGHQTHRWNPKMKPYIFGARSNIYIIDLEKTVDCLNVARDFIKDLTVKGGRVLFVGTKKQAKYIIQDEANACDMFSVTHRWMGGTLTNFETVKKSITKLDSIEKMFRDETTESLTKKEIGRINKEKEKLLLDLGGIREMTKVPEAIFIVDPKREHIAVKEARKLGIPIVAIVDTNCDPEVIDYPIPGNDDALKSIQFISSLIVESIKEGRKEYATAQEIAAKAREAEEKERAEKAKKQAEEKAAADKEAKAAKESKAAAKSDSPEKSKKSEESKPEAASAKPASAKPASEEKASVKDASAKKEDVSAKKEDTSAKKEDASAKKEDASADEKKNAEQSA